MKKNKDLIKGLNILDGVITWNSFDIDENLSFKEQEFSLTEDLLQITFGSRYTLDVGWQPDLDPKGSFVVYAVQDKDWDNPLLKKTCKSLPLLKKTIKETAFFIDKMRKENLPRRNVEYEEFD